MSAKKNVEEETTEIIDKMDQLIREAEGLLQQADDFYQDLGIERDSAKRFLESDKVPEHQRQKVLQELAEWEEEVAADIRDAQARFKAEKGARRSRPRVPRMRI